MPIINGKPEMRYDRGYREYNINGIWLPSVTSVLNCLPKPALEIWKKRHTKEEQEKIKKRTANIGELVHYNSLQQWANDYNKRTGEYIHQDLPDFITDPNNNIADLVKKYEKHVEEARRLFDQFLALYGHRIKILDIETGIYHLNPNYAGRYDIKGQIYEGGKWYNMLADIKTSKKVHKESVGLQLTAYNKAEGNWAERLYVLRLHPYREEGREPNWEFTRVDQNLRIKNVEIDLWDKFEEVYGMFNNKYGNNSVLNKLSNNKRFLGHNMKRKAFLNIPKKRNK